MSTTPVLSANFSGLTTEINRVFSVMSGKTPVLSGPIGATGPGGPTGPIGATGSTGPIGIGIGTTLKGAWIPGGTYSLNSGSPDAVTYNGAFYVCIVAVTGSAITPDQNTTNWLRYVQQGGTGPTGPIGATGLPGATGIGIGTTLQGGWQNGANYYSRSGVNADAVTYSGGFYVCINTVTPSTVSPNLDTANWLAYVDIGPTGPSGSIGINGVTGPTGPVGIGIGTTLKGAWVAGQAYSTNSGTNPDAVTYDGSLYICIQAVTSSVTPDQDPTKWQLYVRQGGTGPSGPPGASGLTGVTGLKGDTGFTGPTGITGPAGTTGVTGPAGNISSVGSDGQLLYNRGGALGATGSMMFRSTGPTGPLGQATGPIGQPTLQLGAYLLPTTDATYDLGATGIQFKDVHFSGSLYNNGVPFSGGGGAVSGLTYRATGPTGPQGQATGPAPYPTLQMAAYLIPTTDATYDLGATGIRFKDEFLSGSLYMGATGAIGVNILQTGRIPSHTLEDTTTGPTLNYLQTLTKPGLYTTTAIYGSLTPDPSVQIQYTPKVILNSARGYATGPTALINGDILGAVAFNENGTGPGQYRALIVSRKTGAAETNDASIEFGTIQGGGLSQMIINSTGPTGPTGQATGPVGKNIGLNAHMYPMDDATYNLGATGYQFKDVHFSGTIYNNGTAFQGGVSGLTYRATGPTGPLGQATGPAPSPTLQVGAYLVPTTTATYDLGATGIQFKDVHFSGSLYNSGRAIQEGPTGLVYRATGPTGPLGQATGPTGPTLQMTANLVPTTTATYDLGATGIQFKDVHFSGSLYNSGRAIQEGPTGLVYRATGPTGPLGQATGPTGPTLQMTANLVPTTTAIYDLGATGIQFKDVHFSGSLYNNGSAFQGGISGLTYRATGPTGPQGQATGPTGPTLQINAHLVPDVDLAYDLGATGLRFRDIHVGGSTIYLGDLVSIKATNEGALTVTNNAGTVNLVTPTGFNGGTLSGTGVIVSNSGNLYGEHVFSSPFAYPPIVLASINNVTYIDAKLYIPTDNVTETECRVYSDTEDATYNWIATARTDYPFSFYNVTTPITLVTANPTSLVLSVNTSLLLRAGLPPYTGVEIQADIGGGNLGFAAVPITINTGVQTITINALDSNQTYYIYITATDSSDLPVTITSEPQDFTTDYAPLNIGGSQITTAQGDTDGEYTSTKITVNTITQNVTGGSGSGNYIFRLAYSPSNSAVTFDANNNLNEPWQDFGESVLESPETKASLTANTTYYFIMYVYDSAVSTLQPVFTTPIAQVTAAAAAPTVTTITAVFNLANGNIVLTGSATGVTSLILTSGMCYGTTNPPTIANTTAPNTISLPDILVSDNIAPGFTYYVRAYATNQQNLTGYGSVATIIVPAE